MLKLLEDATERVSDDGLVRETNALLETGAKADTEPTAANATQKATDLIVY